MNCGIGRRVLELEGLPDSVSRQGLAGSTFSRMQSRTLRERRPPIFFWVPARSSCRLALLKNLAGVLRAKAVPSFAAFISFLSRALSGRVNAAYQQCPTWRQLPVHRAPPYLSPQLVKSSQSLAQTDPLTFVRPSRPGSQRKPMRGLLPSR